jgi:hypothetical protein
MAGIVHLSMNMRILLLVCLLCLTTGAAMATSEYIGGDIQLGGSGIKITQVATTISPSLTTTVTSLPALDPTGSLSVTTTPAGATVFIDGIQRGVSPATISGLEQGGHTLLLKLDGYADIMAPVTVTAGQKQAYTTVLVPVGTPLPAHPAATKSPGFEAVPGIAVLGALLWIRKNSS